MPCFAGDDSIYPMFTSPPLNHSFYKGRLEFAHGLGMNFVRHHSHILPIEYFNAGEKRHFLRCHLYIKCIILPRQARDKHRESTQKRVIRVSHSVRGRNHDLSR